MNYVEGSQMSQGFYKKKLSITKSKHPKHLRPFATNPDPL